MKKQILSKLQNKCSLFKTLLKFKTLFKISQSSILVLFSISTIAFSQIAQAEPEDALSELKAILSPIQSIQGNFNQRVMNERGRVMQQSNGKMWIKKPGLFRWEVYGKDRHLVVSNGKQVFDYDADLSQVTVQTLKGKGANKAPIYFLTGDVNNLGDDFTVKSIGSGKCMQGSDACFELKPKGSGGNFQWIKVGFLEKNLKEIELSDHLGQKSNFSFQNVSLNPNISPKQFQFAPPKGVDVVKN